MQRLIVDTVASYHDEILEFTKELVAVPTENPPGRSYRACADLIERKLGEIGLECTVLQVPPEGAAAPSGDPYPRYCVLASYGGGKRTLYFHGHYDVVPAGSELQFRPYVKDGNLFGRGSSDMKSGLAAMIYAVKAVKESGISLSAKIGLTIVPDEETGGMLGAQYLARAGLLGRDGMGMLLPEPTSGVIWNASRGAISLKVTAKGKLAHVALHHQGVNAFEQMLVVARALLEVKAEVEARRTAFTIKPDAAQRSILVMGGRCEGGTSFNTVPGECSFTIDRRINPEENLKQEKQRLFELFDRLRRDGIDLEVEVIQEGESTGVSENDAVAQALAGSVQAITGETPAFEMCPGLLETRFYAQRGIPALSYGPGVLSVSHGPEEYVQIKNIHNCAAIYALTAARLCAK